MPRGDKRGPEGMGPMTGRGAGYCNGSDRAGFVNAGGYGRGFRGGPGYGRGSGRGYGRGLAPSWPGYQVAPASRETEQSYLESEISFLRDQLQHLESRLDGLKGEE